MINAIHRRSLLQAAGASALLATIGQEAAAQARTNLLTIVTPYVPGGSSDVLCRQVATKLSPGYASSVIVENKTGGAAQIAVGYVKRLPADGATILQAPFVLFTLYPFTYKALQYDPDRDFIPLTVACYFDVALAVGPSVPASVKSVPEFLAWIKANPGKGFFGTSGVGTIPHFVGIMLGRQAGVTLTHTPYRGAQASILDLLGGSIPAVVSPVGDVMAHVADGKVRILGVSSEGRNAFVPDVPSFADQGITDMVHKGYFAFYAHAKTPPDLVARMNAALRQALADKAVVDSLATFGMNSTSSTPAEAADLMKTDRAKWEAVVRQVGFVSQ